MTESAVNSEITEIDGIDIPIEDITSFIHIETKQDDYSFLNILNPSSVLLENNEIKNLFPYDIEGREVFLNEEKPSSIYQATAGIDASSFLDVNGNYVDIGPKLLFDPVGVIFNKTDGYDPDVYLRKFETKIINEKLDLFLDRMTVFINLFRERINYLNGYIDNFKRSHFIFYNILRNLNSKIIKLTSCNRVFLHWELRDDDYFYFKPLFLLGWNEDNNCVFFSTNHWEKSICKLLSREKRGYALGDLCLDIDILKQLKIYKNKILCKSSVANKDVFLNDTLNSELQKLDIDLYNLSDGTSNKTIRWSQSVQHGSVVKTVMEIIRYADMRMVMKMPSRFSNMFKIISDNRKILLDKIQDDTVIMKFKSVKITDTIVSNTIHFTLTGDKLINIMSTKLGTDNSIGMVSSFNWMGIRTDIYSIENDLIPSNAVFYREHAD